MKLLYLGIFRNQPSPALELCGEKDLSSFSRFTRDNWSEFLSFFTQTIAERTAPGTRQDVEEKNYTLHSYARTEGIAAIAVTDAEYPALVAHQLLSKIADEFLATHPRSEFGSPSLAPQSISYPALREYLGKFQDPHAADSIMKIQRELDETKIVLHKTIDSVLQRGESLDRLVEKSNGLSAQSKMFYGQAKKQNSCCVIV